VFSLQLAQIGVENSQVLVSATFTIIAGTVLISGFGSRPLALRLGLVEPERNLFILLGANPVARVLATALEAHGAPLRLIDLDRRDLAAARMTGLLTHRGSVFADETWHEAGLDRAACFVALTPSDELNTLAARYAAAVLGRKHVFQSPPGRPEHRAWFNLPNGTFARPLFDQGATFPELDALIGKGARVTATRLTNVFGPEQYRQIHGDGLVLFVVTAKGAVELASGDRRRSPRGR
jgi:hypothetical protein